VIHKTSRHQPVRDNASGSSYLSPGRNLVPAGILLAGMILVVSLSGAAQSPGALPDPPASPATAETSAVIPLQTPEPRPEDIIACLADAEAVSRARDEARAAIDLWSGRRDPVSAWLEAPPEGVSTDLVQARLTVIDEALGAWQRRQHILDALGDLRDKTATLRAALNAFSGLDEKPPYTLQFCDRVYRTAEARRVSRDAEQVAFETAWSYLEATRKEKSTLDAAINRAAEALQSAREPERAAAAFALETAKLAREALEARLKEAEAAVCRAASRREQAEVDLELARVRARWVEERTLYRLEELENRQQEEKNTLQSIEKARVKVRRELEKRQAELAAMRRAQEKNPDDPIAMEKALRREQSALEMLDILNESVALESAYTDLLKRRLAAMNPELAREFQLILTLNEWLDFFRKQQQRYESLRNSEQQRLIALQTELNDWEATTGDDNATPRDPMGAVMVPLLRERIPLLDRLVTRYGDLAFLAARGVEQVNDRLVSRSLIDRLYARVTEIRKHAGTWLDYGLIDTGGVPVTPRKLIAAVFILAIGMMLVRLLMGRLRAGLFRRLKERSHAAYVAETLLHYALILLVGYITLRYLNIPLTVFAFLGGAVAIGVGFGAQNLISNFLSGLILMGEQQVRLNDIVEVDGLTGRVTHIGARASTVHTFNGVDVLVPNSKFLENNVINWTLSSNQLRFEITVGAAYGSDPTRVIEILEQAAAGHGNVLKDPPPLAVLSDFGDNALLFTLYLWVDVNHSDSRVVRSDVRRKIYRDFARSGIEIAFPQLDVHLRHTTPDHPAPNVSLSTSAQPVERPSTDVDKGTDT